MFRGQTGNNFHCPIIISHLAQDQEKGRGWRTKSENKQIYFQLYKSKDVLSKMVKYLLKCNFFYCFFFFLSEELWRHDALSRSSQQLRQKRCWLCWVRIGLQELPKKAVTPVHTTETGTFYLKLRKNLFSAVCSVSLSCCMLFYSSAVSILIAAIVIFPSLWKAFVARCCLSFVPQ